MPVRSVVPTAVGLYHNDTSLPYVVYTYWLVTGAGGRAVQSLCNMDGSRIGAVVGIAGFLFHMIDTPLTSVMTVVSRHWNSTRSQYMLVLLGKNCSPVFELTVAGVPTLRQNTRLVPSIVYVYRAAVGVALVVYARVSPVTHGKIRG